MASERKAKGIPAGYEEVNGVIRRTDDGTPLLWRDCKTATEKVRWHQQQAEKIMAEETARERKNRNHRLIENAAHIEYLINAKLIGEDEAEKKKKSSDYEITLDDDKKLAEELASLYISAHPEKFSATESQVTVIENATGGSWQ